MLNVIFSGEPSVWDRTVRSYPDWDVYYLCAYARSLELHGDGRGVLIEYRDGASRVCWVVMQKDVALDPKFRGSLPDGAFFDWETPYGYGGPLCDGEMSEPFRRALLRELGAYCVEHHIVSQFIRFHPLLQNQTVLPDVIEARYMRDTIEIDTGSEETIWRNLDSKNRNMIRKAQKCGVTVVRRPISAYTDFLGMYRETMEWRQAEAYYFFSPGYFAALDALDESACFFYALSEDRPIAGSIFLYNERNMHYHLSGSYAAYRDRAPSNLLLYEAAKWACGRGIRRFHLGGGLTQDDSLFGFKKQFNKNGRLPWYVGRTVFDPKAYQALLSARKRLDASFDEDNPFMIQYRR